MKDRKGSSDSHGNVLLRMLLLRLLQMHSNDARSRREVVARASPVVGEEELVFAEGLGDEEE